MAAGSVGSSEQGQAAASGTSSDTSVLGSSRTWPLQRYGRFLPPREEEDEGQNISWKVFESNEESGPLTLTIVVSGHFFISQGRTVLEGFSLIDSHKWLRIVRRADCLLLQARAQNKCRMFRVQFGGNSKEQALEHCCSCIGKLMEYLPVQGAEGQSLSQDPQGTGTEQWGPDEPLPDSCSSLGERRSLAQLAQSVLSGRAELHGAYQHTAWRAQDLGPFIRLCLMDQHFPAFVQDVEKELQKLTEG